MPARYSYERKDQDTANSGCASDMLVSPCLCLIAVSPTRQFTCHQRSPNEDFSGILVAQPDRSCRYCGAACCPISLWIPIGQSCRRFFAVLFLFIAFSNHIAVTDTHGLAVVTGNLVSILIVGLLWVWEVYRPQNNYVFERLPAWRYWVLPFAFLAFWSPIDAQLNPDFNPLLLLNSSFGVMYCPTTPVIIALLTFIYPRVNTYVLRTTSFVGLVIGLFNIISYFIMPGYTLWNLVLHTPLIFISLYGLLIPILVKTNNSSQESQ